MLDGYAFLQQRVRVALLSDRCPASLARLVLVIAALMHAVSETNRRRPEWTPILPFLNTQ